MYTDLHQWKRIRARVLIRGESHRSVAASEGIHRATLRKMIRFERPPGFQLPTSRRSWRLGKHQELLSKLLIDNDEAPLACRRTSKQLFDDLQKEGYRGNCGPVRYQYMLFNRSKASTQWHVIQNVVKSLSDRDAARFLKSLLMERDDEHALRISEQRLRNWGVSPNPPNSQSLARQRWLEWLYAVERQDWSVISDRLSARRAPLTSALLPTKSTQRQKALSVLAVDAGFSQHQVAKFLSISRVSVRKYLSDFSLGGPIALFGRKLLARKADDPELRNAVFALMHEPPSASGINRTTWKMVDIQRVLKERGYPVGPEIIRAMLRQAGYRWTSARVVLTSNDPNYREKLEHIQEILSNLELNERFFSIDEFGPFAVKIKGGRLLAAPGIQPTVPQWQKSKGCLILTAALELSSNQVTHFYSTAKNTVEMIRMATALIGKYKDSRKLYLSWDAASWHLSKKLNKFVDEHNPTAHEGSLPILELAPLPARAQFLNVIESVFSGMARAIIHNSNYPSVDAVMQAIDRYFNERNLHFLNNPKRAGKKLWGAERTTSEFSAGNNCKDPAYR